MLISKKLSLNISENADFVSKHRPNTEHFFEFFRTVRIETNKTSIQWTRIKIDRSNQKIILSKK